MYCDYDTIIIPEDPYNKLIKKFEIDPPIKTVKDAKLSFFHRIGLNFGKVLIRHGVKNNTSK